MKTADEYIDRVLYVLPRATPMRAQIALELRGLFAERAANGQTVDEIVTQLGDPARLAESYLAAVPLVAAPFWTRVAAKLIDFVVTLAGVLALMMPIAWFFWLSNRPTVLAWTPLMAILCGSFGFFAYTIIAEFAWGQTVGKRALGIRAVQESGARITFGQAAVRQLPLMLQIMIIDALFALFTDKSQRAFEMVSKTRVVLVPQEHL
jgi:uncharacterized RDD family membrane protein YckC